MSLQQELADAEAQVERLKRQIASGTCAERGHDWKRIGGCNYGDNDEAKSVKANCIEGFSQ